MAEPNLLLDALIEAAGLSHAGLAARINAADRHFRYDHASVARWIRDGAIPRTPVPDLICEIVGRRLGRSLLPVDIGMARGRSSAFGTTLDQVVEQAKALWRADHRDHTVIAQRQPIVGPAAVAPLFEWENPPPDIRISHNGPRLVGQCDITNILVLRTHYEQMYRRVGGVPVRSRLAMHLTTTVTAMLDGRYDDRTGRLLFRAVGGLVAFAGVCAYDADRQGMAQRYFFHALRMAKASGDRAFGGYVVALLTNQAIYLGDFRLAIQYAETALRAGRGVLSPALRSDLHAMQAKAYAGLGELMDCIAQMRNAEKAAGLIKMTEEPAETNYVHPGLMELKNAEALLHVGELRQAQTFAEACLQLGPTDPRGTVYGYATIAMILAARREIDESLVWAQQALATSKGMESWRIRDRLNLMTQALEPFSGGGGKTNDVRDFLVTARHSLEAPL